MNTMIYHYGERKDASQIRMLFLTKDGVCKSIPEITAEEVLEQIVSLGNGMRAFRILDGLAEEINQDFVISTEEFYELLEEEEILIDRLKSMSPAEWTEHMAARYFKKTGNKKELELLLCGMI